MEVFNKKEEVKKELAAIETNIKEVNDKVTAEDINGLIVLANEGNLSAYGPGSRFGIVHDVLGVKPVDANLEVSTHGQNISFEYVVEKNPDYLFVIDRGAAVDGQTSAQAVIENSLIKNTKAYKEGHVVYLDPSYWYLSGGGLVSVAELVKEIDEGTK